MKKLTEVFQEKPRTFSFEFFPPKTDKGLKRLYQTAEDLAPLADFFSVTYGAGGSDSKRTTQVAAEMQKLHNIPVVHHYSCFKHSFDHVRKQMDRFREADIRNILAMRGDPPADDPDYTPGPDEPQYAYQLVETLREYDDYFCLGVAGFPEGHPNTPTKDLDSKYLEVKQSAGADFVLTQLFFDNDIYYEFRDRVRDAGVTMRLIPGILIITDYERLLNFCSRCEATIPQRVHDIFKPLADDKDAMRQRGIEFAIEQCQDLLDNGAPGLHLYCLNRTEPAKTVYDALNK